ncbi:TetR/AcrR family transcriptional regulator [Clostridium cochlearium]|uniref:TetR/AcrR family transcriptional regulator n=1 Tax=Clostridium cochlearium TaxID=1494 RepID=UPI00156DDE4D|nr:TetR/AcrR family transcriptional regulator [Clostridium cochlearium]MCG4580265.1 TetR/AcrR family transcriptional regulator [Clostridium cochlearium]NSJ92121.1 TetR/AcrR family transcriptional regulator [Coprococcus sp. MSK.21.13]
MNKTKKLIFKAAIKIFSQNGYNGTTMDDIAKEANVAKGTLYYHFKSKEEIFKFIIDGGMDIISEKLEDISKQEGDSISKLKAVCKAQLSVVYENRDFFKVIMSQLWGSEIRQLEIREKIEKYIKDIEKYIKDAVKEGTIKNGETYFMAYAIFGMLCSTSIYELINEDKEKIDKVADSLMDYILKGIES